MLLDEQIETKDANGNSIAPEADILIGNQNGYMPEMAIMGADGKTLIEAWGNNSAYVTSNIIAIPLSVPEFLGEFGTASKKLKQKWIEMMSTLPVTIEGLVDNLTVENDEHQVGASGALFMQEHTKVTQARSTLTLGYVERVGKPINNFGKFLIRWGIGEENSQAPLVSTLPSVREAFKKKARLQPYYTGSVMYIELDKMNVNVINAWLAVGVRLNGSGEITGKRDLTTGGEIVRYTIEASATIDTNDVIKAQAQRLIDKMSIWKKNPQRDALSIPVSQTEQDITTQLAKGFNEEAFKVGGDDNNTIKGVYDKA